MQLKTHRFKPTMLLKIIFLIVVIATPINGSDSRKLDETTVPGSGDQGIKCTSSCTQIPPPPPPPVYPPPPPACPPPPAPVHPPPSPKKPPSENCPPPPPPSFIYITGPPGNLYPIDQGFGAASRNSMVGLPVLVVFGLLGLMALW